MRCKSHVGFSCLIAALTLLATHPRFASAGILPDNRVVDWTPGVMVGVPGGIPVNRTHIIDVTAAPYKADKTGATFATAAIQAAINDAVANDIIYLPAGTYKFDQSLYISKNSITIRGAGSNTIINLTGGAGFCFVGTASDYDWKYPTDKMWITNPLTKGVTTLNISDTSAFEVGKIVQIAIANDPKLPVMSVSGFTEMRRQKTRITAKNATSLTIFPPIYGNYSPNACRVSMSRLQAEFVGVEDLTVDSSNSTTPYGIYFEQAYGCWVKNVHSMMAGNYHVFFYDCLQCEVRDCFLDRLNHVGTNGSGLLVNSSSGCLFENNIIYKAFPLIEVNHGSCGNVFGYNFCEDSTVYGSLGVSIDSNHGPHNSYNLYEGNVSANLQADGYFGGTSEDLAFRNWFHGTGPGVGPSVCFILNRFSRNISAVGNIFGTNGVSAGIYSFGNPNMGNGNFVGYGPPWADQGKTPGPAGFQELDTNVQATVILLGNFNYRTNGIPAAESLGSTPLPNSMYLTSKPAWFGNMTWPPFDPANPKPSKVAIPAGFRYYNNVTPPTGRPAPISYPGTLAPSPN